MSTTALTAAVLTWSSLVGFVALGTHSITRCTLPDLTSFRVYHCKDETHRIITDIKKHYAIFHNSELLWKCSHLISILWGDKVSKTDLESAKRFEEKTYTLSAEPLILQSKTLLKLSDASLLSLPAEEVILVKVLIKQLKLHLLSRELSQNYLWGTPDRWNLIIWHDYDRRALPSGALCPPGWIKEGTRVLWKRKKKRKKETCI